MIVPHYVNEARVIAFALTGEFKSLDRDSLSATDQRILRQLKMCASALISMGKTCDERNRFGRGEAVRSVGSNTSFLWRKPPAGVPWWSA
ncbi:hypothetical protein [Burkholderia territorii]|uniref:hypothetical protein n=1 Tax=Burkholderia territorii TaxID=1503055 RepID=UPI000A40B28B|nr:hypothetical protein [Burkholderia territorii]